MTRFYLFLASIATIAFTSTQALAHGARIEYQETTAIEIQAKYDDGKPMANAQVVVYAPRDRATPWLKGTTDESGNFAFVPDFSAENIGNWDVKVRQSGHGSIASIAVDKQKATVSQMRANTSAGGGYTSSQKIIMAAAMSWGFLGTALFFARKSDK
ncbi:MAG: carboxypeptidase regulatory-like domain-containing protein [Cyanobacteria bacterium P01_G01_bin.19]